MTPALQQDNLLICFHIILVGLVSSGRKIQDVFSGSVHSVESPEATHVDCVQTGWCVRLWGRVEQGEDGTEVAWTPFLLICTLRS